MNNNTKTNKSRYVILGYILIIIGISMPLYGFLNISYRNLTQKEKYHKFLSEDLKFTKEESQGIDEYNKKIKNNYIVDPFTNEEYSAQYEFYTDNPDKVFAYLKIPKLNIIKPIYLDASYEHLDKGVAHIDGTSLPVGGIGRRSVIAGHRGWYRDLMFFNIHKLENQDEVFVVRGEEVLKYQVTDKEVILPSDWDALQPRKDVDMLTLLTCEPLRPPRPKRLLINCVRIEEAEEKELEDIKDVEVDNSVKKLDLVVYLVTTILILLLAFNVFKLIKYI